MLKKRMIDNKRTDPEIIPNSNFFLFKNSNYDSKNLYSKNSANKHMMILSHNNKFEKKLFCSEGQNLHIDYEKRKKAFKIYKSFSPLKFSLNVISKRKNFSQSPILRKNSNFKNKSNLSEILNLKKVKKSFDLETLGCNDNNNSWLSSIENNGYKLNHIKNGNFELNKKYENFDNNIYNKIENNLHFNQYNKFGNLNLFRIIKSKKSKSKYKNLNNTKNDHYLYLNKQNKSENFFQKYFKNRENIIFGNKFRTFYETPIRKRFSKSAHSKIYNKNDTNIKSEKNSFKEIINYFVQENSWGYIRQNQADDALKIKRHIKCRRISINNSNEKSLSNPKKYFPYRKLTIDDHFLYSCKKEKEKNNSKDKNKIFESPNSLDTDTNFFKENMKDINKNPFKIQSKNNFDKNSFFYDDIMKNKINNNKLSFINNNFNENTNFKTNFKSEISNNNSATAFQNTENPFENQTINFAISEVKKNLHFGDIVKTENKNSSKGSFNSFDSFFQERGLNSSINSLRNNNDQISKNNFLEYLKSKKEERFESSNGSISKNSPANSDKNYSKSQKTNSSNISTINIRTNFYEYFFSYNLPKIDSLNSNNENLNEVIMGDINFLNEKENKLALTCFEIKNNQYIFNQELLKVEIINFYEFNKYKETNTISRASLNKSAYNNLSPLNSEKFHEIREDDEVILNNCNNIIGLNFSGKSNDHNNNISSSFKESNENFYEYEDVQMTPKVNLIENNEQNKSKSEKILTQSNKSRNFNESINNLYFGNNNYIRDQENSNFQSPNIKYDIKPKQLNEFIENEANNFNNFLSRLNSNNLINQNIYGNNNQSLNTANNIDHNSKEYCNLESKNDFTNLLKNQIKYNYITNNHSKTKVEASNDAIEIISNSINDFVNKNNQINNLNTVADQIRRDYINEIFFENESKINKNFNSNNSNLNINFPTSQIPLYQTENSSIYSQNIPCFSPFDNTWISNLNYPPQSFYNANINQTQRNQINSGFYNYNNNNQNNSNIYQINGFINNPIQQINNNILSQSHQSSVNLNLPNSIYATQLTNNNNNYNNLNDINNAYLDLQLSNAAFSQNSTKVNSIAQSIEQFDNKELFPYIFNHKLLPPGKENDEVLKAKLSNLMKSHKLPQFHSDFHKKRHHSEMLNYNMMATNYRNSLNIYNTNYENRERDNIIRINIDESTKQNKQIYFDYNQNLIKNNENDDNQAYNQSHITKDVNSRPLLRICEEDLIEYKGGIPEYVFMKYRKISSCKTNYSSYISFSTSDEMKVYFKIYRDSDLGFEEKYQKLTKIHVIFYFSLSFNSNFNYYLQIFIKKIRLNNFQII